MASVEPQTEAPYPAPRNYISSTVPGGSGPGGLGKMETATIVEMATEVLVLEAVEARELADLVTVTGDQELMSALKATAERIALEAESEARALYGRARSLRAEAAQAYATVSEMAANAGEDAQLSALAAEQVTDEALRRHLEQIVRDDEARLQEGLESIQCAQARVETANEEARALELDAEAALQRARSRPEVIAWRQVTEPFMELIGRSRSTRVVAELLEDAERQGLADERLRQQAACRTRQLGQLAWHTRETVKLWARYAPGGDGMYSAVTHPAAALLAAASPGTIFEVSSDGRKVAVHLSEDGFAWVRRNAGGPFRPRGALVRQIDRRTDPAQADAT